MKFTHIMLANGANTFRFIRAFYNNLNKEEYYQHEFLIMATLNYVVKNCPSILVANDENLMFLPTASSKRKETRKQIDFIKNKIENADLVIWHSGLTINNIQIARLANKYATKSIWITDFDDRLIPNTKSGKLSVRRLKNKKLKFMKTVKYVDFSIPWVAKNFCADYGYEKLISSIPYPVQNEYVCQMDKCSEKPNENLVCLVGFDGRKTNKHDFLLYHLKHLADEKIKIILPMNFAMFGEWGTTEKYTYRDRIKFVASSIFGDASVCKLRRRNVHVDEYFKMIASCDIGVFNDNRSINWPLFFFMLYLGKKVFIKATNVLSVKLREMYLPVYTLTELDNMSADELKSPAAPEHFIDVLRKEQQGNRCESEESLEDNEDDYEINEESDSTIPEESDPITPEEFDEIKRRCESGKKWLSAFLSEQYTVQRWQALFKAAINKEDYQDPFEIWEKEE